MSGVVGVHVAEGAGQVLQCHFDRPACIRHLFGAKDDQTAVAGATLGVARQFDLDHFGVGRFDGFIRCQDLWPGAGAGADDADRAILRIQTHGLVQHWVHVGNHDAEGVADRGADKFRNARIGRPRWGSIGGCRCARDLLHHLCYHALYNIVLH